jgi:ABC-type nitrate/sulfonate/bicarbonate transport system substrate-binding protein
MLSFIALATALLVSLATPSLALDTVRLGKAVPNSFAFGAAEVGIDAKIFAADGLDVTVSSFRGDAQLQQALAAGSVDVGLGSGPGLGFRVKGAPMIGVAAMYGAPRNLALLVAAKSPIRSVADLRMVGARTFPPTGVGVGGHHSRAARSNAGAAGGDGPRRTRWCRAGSRQRLRP